MPRQVFQKDHAKLVYIGSNVKTPKGSSATVMIKCPVWQWHDRGWIQLNADPGLVDFSINHIDYDSANINFVPDYDDTRIGITVGNRAEVVITNMAQRVYVASGLAANTEYDVTLRAYTFGAWGKNSTKTFRTQPSPVPAGVTGLRYTTRSNTSITLDWNPAARADKYEVYRAVGSGSFSRIATTGTTSAYTVAKLREDTKYAFKVRAISTDGGGAGPFSGVLKSQTGHASITHAGSCTRYALPVRRTGSWRPDIQWGYWPGWPHGGYNYDVYQGYWQFTNKRYRGIVEYDPAALRAQIDRHFGAGVSAAIRVTRCEIRKVQRRPDPGSGAAQELHWRLTNCAVRQSKAQPPVYQLHINNRNSADAVATQRSIKRGQTINFLRLPRSWGQAIIDGKYAGTKVNGIALYRGDNIDSGYGSAGYLSTAEDGEGSNWDLMITGNWSITTRTYAPPKDW